MRSKTAAFVAAQLIIVVLVLILISLPLGKSPEPYTVMKDNLTVTGEIAYNVACLPISSCSIPYGGVYSSGAIHGVELVRYEGTYYYRYVDPVSGTFGLASPTTYSASGSTTTTMTTTLVGNPTFIIWFTNSTIYCASEDGFSYEGSPNCPG